ncbi:MAG TPA: VWA domain-containing protein [Verrucomicrobiota bacterium]|nr:VWA domain-containing protein [Verrucomicrobiota bacterium]
MRFGNPRMLWLLALAAPLLIWFLHWAWRQRQKLIGQFVQSRLLAQLTVGVSKGRQKLRLALLGLAVLLMMFALARPQYGFAWEQVSSRGLDILVGIDTSRSMLATDVLPNRLARAKLAALDLMRSARSDRLGLIAFAGTAFLQCPLTLDDNAFSENVNYLDVGVLPQGGTALAAAIETAMRAFANSENNFKILVLITDGEDHEEGVIEAAERAAKEGIRIFTVGVGTLEGDRIKIEENGKTSYIKDENGNVVVSKLNSTLLQKIAEITHGDYIALQGADTMKILYESRIGPLPRRDMASRLFRQYHERYQWPLALAILCMIAEMFVRDRQRVERPKAIVQSGHPMFNKLVGTAILLVAGLFTRTAAADNALRAYEAGRFKEAQREYQKLLNRNPKDPRLRFNAGTAAYRAGDLAAATNELFQATLSSDPALLQRAYYNLGNAKYRIGEQAENPAATAMHWKEAIADYDSALKLDPNDQDAKFNRELVAKKLEELEKQLQQQRDQSQANQNKQDQQQDQQQNQSQAGSQQQQQDQRQSNEQDKQNQNQQQESKNRQPQNTPSEEQKEQTPQPSPDDKQEQKNPTQEDVELNPAGKQEQSPGDDKGESRPMFKEGQMTPEQARQLLDAARADERAWILVPPGPRRTRTYREW